MGTDSLAGRRRAGKKAGRDVAAVGVVVEVMINMGRALARTKDGTDGGFV